MAYAVFIKKQAKKVLEGLSRVDRQRIAEKIVQLGNDPSHRSLDIKFLEGQQPCYRLRVGQWRIIFARDDTVKIISIEKIKPRGDAYK